MARLSMTTTHELKREEAVRRVKKRVASLISSYPVRVKDVHQEWNGDTLSFRFKAVGSQVSGTVIVTDSEVRVAAKVPFALLLFKKRIYAILRVRLAALLS